MKRDLIDAFTSPTSDPEFGKKYAITALCSAGSMVLIGAPFLLGYVAQTIKHSSAGKKGLPEWKNVPELLIQGGACFLSGVYTLPALMLMALAYLPLMMGGNTVFSVSGVLFRFIMFGALILMLTGMAFSLAAMHSYLHSQQLGDLFNVGKIVRRIKAHVTELGTLLAITGVVLLASSLVTTLLGTPGVLLSVLATAMLSLVVGYRTGSIFGSEAEAIPQLEAGDLAPDEAAPALPAADLTVEGLPSTESEPEVEVWKPT